MRSVFGDEFLNAPSFLGRRPPPAETKLTGWMEIRFDEPDGGCARFSLDYRAVGTDEELVWGGGQRFALLRNRLKPMAFLPGGIKGWTGGVLDLDTGIVDPDSVRISASFQNSLIAAVGARSRAPFSFPFIYPAPELPPAALPPGANLPAMLPEHGLIEFGFAPDGEITGVELRAETNALVSLFPRLGLFPPFSFGPSGKFFFAHPTSSLPGTPARICPTPEEQADGIHLPFPAYFHPHLKLVSESVHESLLREGSVWQTKTPAGRDRAAVVALGRKLFCFGGFDDANVSERALVFDLDSATWDECTPLPIAVAACCAVAVNERIFVIGGWTDNEQTATEAVQVYNVNTGSWSFTTPLPVALAAAAAAVLDGEVYVAGGWTPSASGAISDGLYIYDRTTNLWAAGPEMLLPVADASAVFIGSDLYVINGRLDLQTITNRVSVFSTRIGLWGIGPSTDRGIYQAAVAITSRRVMLLGGRSAIDGATEPWLQQLELATGTWREGLPPLLGTAGAGAATIGETIWLVWGRSQTGAESPPGRVTDLIQTLSAGSAWRAYSQRPVFSAADVFNGGAGILAPRELSPGGRAVVLGHNLDGQFSPEKEITNVEVLLDSLPAKIVRCEPDRIEFVVPQLEIGESVRLAYLQVIPPAGADYAWGVDVPVASAAPNVFALTFMAANFDEFALREPCYLEDASALAANEDGTLNCPLQPERPGGLISLLVTGLGWQAAELLTPNPLPDMSGTVDGQVVPIERLSTIPDYPGVYALSLRLPLEISVGSNLHRVVIFCGRTKSNPVTISIQAKVGRPDTALTLADGLLTVLG
ncbi:MAG TPA: hypothetical protein VNJ70_15705 [Thermoanaerobaculia bacterium]|nr:hypothetical protein [Thermoanaerobaculia bacterium]